MLDLLLDEGTAREVGYRGYVLRGKSKGEAVFLPSFLTGEEEGRVGDLVVRTTRLSRIDDTAA